MKKKVLLAAAVGTLTIAPALTFVTSCGNKNKLSESHILSINDFHGAAPGYGDPDFKATSMYNPGAIRLASEFEGIKAKYPGSIAIACGDLNAGEAFSTCEKAKTFYPVCKAMDIRYSTVGNHAWEWGSEPLESYQYDYLARTDKTVGNYFFTSNVLNGANYRAKTWNCDPESYRFADDYNLWKKQRVEWADPFKLVDMNGHLVCLIGLTTKDTLTDGNMESMKTLSFIDYNASVVYSKMYCYETIGEDAFNKIDAFILDTHLECQATDKDHPMNGVEGEAARLAAGLTTRIDGILAAHSHQICHGIVHNETLNKDIPVAQGGQAARRYVDTALVFDDSKKKGKRLKSVTMTVVTPTIDGISNPDDPDFDAATAQIKKIVKETTSDVVKNVAEVYDEQKKVALNNLENPVGKVHKVPIERTGEPTVYGLPYWYIEKNRKFGTSFYQSPTLLEPAGVWADIAMVQAFNNHYDEYIKAGKCYPAAVAITNLDSLKSGFNYIGVETEDQWVQKKDVFQMHSFENPVHYGCLTWDQLKQYINYILDGAGKFNYGRKSKYETKLYYDSKDEKTELIWNPSEKVNNDTELGTSYVSGPSQFYGMSFKIKEVSSCEEGKVYKLVDDSLRIYDPTVPANMYDPSKWLDEATWASKFNGYVPVVMASFTWQGGNAQNRMLHHWFDYNALSDTLAGHQVFDMYTRGTALEYLKWLNTQHPTWTVNQISDTAYIDNAFIKQLIDVDNA